MKADLIQTAFVQHWDDGETQKKIYCYWKQDLSLLNTVVKQCSQTSALYNNKLYALNTISLTLIELSKK